MVTSTLAGRRQLAEDLRLRPAAGCCHRRPTRQLGVTGDSAAAVRAGCRPVVLWPPACRACSWRAGPWADAHAGGAWHANVAGRRCRLADPRSKAAPPSARLVAQAGQGRGCRSRGRPTSHQRSSPPGLAWPPGQGRRPRRPPRAAFVAPAPPSLHLPQAVTEAGVSHWPARRGNRQGPPGRRPQQPTGVLQQRLPPRAWLWLRRMRRREVQQRQQAIAIAGPSSGPGQAEEEQKLSVHSNRGAGPVRQPAGPWQQPATA